MAVKIRLKKNTHSLNHIAPQWFEISCLIFGYYSQNPETQNKDQIFKF